MPYLLSYLQPDLVQHLVDHRVLLLLIPIELPTHPSSTKRVSTLV
jgi:hypothetical protein